MGGNLSEVISYFFRESNRSLRAYKGPVHSRQMQYIRPVSYYEGCRAVKSAAPKGETTESTLLETQVAWPPPYEFCVSDSSVVTRTPLRQRSLRRTGANGGNTYGVQMGISPGLVKANGAGAMRTKRSRDAAKSISGVPEVYLE